MLALLALHADFTAGPLEIDSRDFATFGIDPASIFDVCSLAHLDVHMVGAGATSTGASLTDVISVIRRAFGARITDSIRPVNATYGARFSWHKSGQAVDFVPAGGVGAITREQIRAVMGAAGIRLIELLGPGDRGHSNHWHVAFARPGQVIDHVHPIEEDEDWVVNVASVDTAAPSSTSEAASTPALSTQVAAKAPPTWDVFASANWRANHGGGS